MIGKVILKNHKHPEGKYERVALNEEEVFSLTQKTAVYNKELMKQCLIEADELILDKATKLMLAFARAEARLSAQIQLATAMFDKLAPKVFTLLASKLEQKVFDIKNGDSNESVKETAGLGMSPFK